MKRRVSKERQDTEVDLTPMLDVVFIMLIFFIVTATFIREKGIDVLRPDESDTPPPPNMTAIVISIDSNSDVWIDGRIVDERAVRANVERLRAETPDAPVLVQTDRRANTGVVIRTMDQAKQAGAAAVSIAAIDD
ncbi:MAG: biopolymer transporter ExbD [Sphingomonadales bacterium]|nr:MAG: biopolymer transporter ExbD [Sphingomonadales bacterium]